jgi:DNA polymerase alpha-associated DNA helicase A
MKTKGVIQAPSNIYDKVAQTKHTVPDTKSKSDQPSTVSPALRNSDSDDSDTEQILDGDEPAQVTPSDPPLNVIVADITKRKTKTKWSGLKPPRTLETTLFDRLEIMYGAGIKRMLTVQYRSVTTTYYFLPRKFDATLLGCTLKFASFRQKHSTPRN